MADADRSADAKTNPDAAAPQPSGAACDATQTPPGPPREGGGTTGAGNLSPMQASRTGGATGGVPDAGTGVAPPRRGVEPDA